MLLAVIERGAERVFAERTLPAVRLGAEQEHLLRLPALVLRE